ncbi:MAG: ABC transporter ATP-binding protein [Bifidobacteriaceae bacterium]|jgi:ABC-2 type transport system ATP-binding protein|nr:ABC transporter ATP-binding protein [Bifidobacteriaceae bacterium]
MPGIEVDHVTKDYGGGRGNFGVDLAVGDGEVFGFVGANGAGKTTLIRQMMGFLRPDSGRVRVGGLDAWADAAAVKRLVGYIPGEIAFPDAPTGAEFLRRQADLLGVADMARAREIADRLQLDPSANLKRMSKGMKQKTAVVAAFMADAPVLVLDEPTTGLDPLMRAEFVELLAAEKAKGKTVFMSSHMFDEVKDTCDRVGLIKEGRIVAVASTDEIRHSRDKVYKIEFATGAGYSRFLEEGLTLVERRDGQLQALVSVDGPEVNRLLAVLKGYQLKFVTEVKHTLEAYFRDLH